MASPLLALASRKRFQKSCTPGGPMQWANPSTPAVAPKVLSNQPLEKRNMDRVPYHPQQDCLGPKLSL